MLSHCKFCSLAAILVCFFLPAWAPVEGKEKDDLEIAGKITRVDVKQLTMFIRFGYQRTNGRTAKKIAEFRLRENTDLRVDGVKAGLSERFVGNEALVLLVRHELWRRFWDDLLTEKKDRSLADEYRIEWINVVRSPLIDKLAVGAAGRLDEIRVQQIVGGSEMICRLAGGATVWIDGLSTEGKVDGASYASPYVFRVTGTKTYTTALGTSKTIFLLKPQK
jgi:hypothetical protein